MKKHFLGVASLFIALTLAFAFKSAPLPAAAQSFEIIDPYGDPLDPFNYQALTFDPVASCPSQSFVCAIVVDSTTDVYPCGHEFEFQPKVDITTTGSLGALIITAIGSQVNADPLTQQGTVRKIYERN